jgi:hypothetical protein
VVILLVSVAAERRAKIFGLQVHSLKLENPPYLCQSKFIAPASRRNAGSTGREAVSVEAAAKARNAASKSFC